MTHSVITGKLASAVADAGTFTASYPSGKNAGSFYLAMSHVLMLGGNKYIFPDDFDVTLGASNITITNKSGGSWPVDSEWRLQMEEPGERQFREVRDRNRAAQTPVTQPALMASMIRGNVSFLNLGAPDTADPNGILDDASATDSAQTYDSDDWESTFDGTLDVPRTLSATGTSGSDHVITITGTDVYDRTMVEKLTLSGTTKQWGKKAFKTVTSVAVAVGQAGDTFDLGWEDFIGLPAFLPSEAHVVGVMQDGILLPPRTFLDFEIEETELLAATSEYILAPFAGSVSRLTTVVQTAIGTGGDITVEIETNAVTGLTVTVADSASVGDIDTDVPTTLDGTDSSIYVAERGDIEIVPAAAFDTSGSVNGVLELNTQGIFSAGLRTGGGSTATTKDIRGTFKPPVACDGSKVWQLAVMLPDPGFAGIEQYAG